MTATTQISFIGKGKLNKITGYASATYRFNNGFKCEHPFFGISLMECIKPGKLVLLGTAGSMWDVFFAQQSDDDAVLQLIEAATHDSVTQDMLQTHQERLRTKLGIPVECILIPYARDKDEQANILSTLASTVTEGERIVLDVTHGFRHLPMLALVAARYLTHVRGVHIENLYYGALEMTDRKTGETPVLELGGLLEMLDWIEALAVYQKSGNYGVFASLYEKDGMPTDRAKMLAQAAYYERSSNPVQARQNLSGAFKHIENHPGVLGKIFSPALSRNLNWFRSEHRADWELALADRYLQRQDYLRTLIYMFESLITSTVRKQHAKNNINDFDDRKEAQQKIVQENPEAKRLGYLRNAQAHGVRSFNDQARRLLQDEQALQQELATLRKNLFKTP